MLRMAGIGWDIIVMD
jgi:hypothetical protein